MVVIKTVIAIIMSFFTSVSVMFSDYLSFGNTSIDPDGDKVTIRMDALNTKEETLIISDYETLERLDYLLDITEYDEEFFEENSLAVIQFKFYTKHQLKIDRIIDSGDTLKVKYSVLQDNCGGLLFTEINQFIIVEVDKDIKNIVVDCQLKYVIHCIHK